MMLVHYVKLAAIDIDVHCLKIISKFPFSHSVAFCLQRGRDKS